MRRSLLVLAFVGSVGVAGWALTGCTCQDSGDCPALPFVDFCCENDSCVICHHAPGQAGTASQLSQLWTLLHAISADDFNAAAAPGDSADVPAVIDGPVTVGMADPAR